ncbi:MAG: T9SS type A sorting domain-containing protein [Bacteroidales bacterium]|nr:T9SS type A sorting domain-containing protein [Bacteroidales bacterium]
MRILLFFAFLYIIITGYSQDTLRLMQYNLLMYGNDFGGCNQSNNNVAEKNEYLKTIVNWVKPDILAVNEIYRTSYYHDLLLDNVFNVNGVNYYERAYPPNLSNGFTINNVFFDSRKLELVGNSVAAIGVRDIDVFKFRYIEGAYADSNLILNCAVAHLKAGDNQDDRDQRANATSQLMQYISNSEDGNYTFSGDFNLYYSSETAFQNLLFYPNENARFYDPVNRIGYWNNNINYADVHTQSTHTGGNCFSGGGLDDRFDFILVSEEIINGSNDIKYVEGSYKAVGQDGQHFNTSITSSPTNASVPSSVLNALYNMSDHLPVSIDFAIGDHVGINDLKNTSVHLFFKNPVSGNFLLHYSVKGSGSYVFQLRDLSGKLLTEQTEYLVNSGELQIPANHLSNGMYILSVKSEGQIPVVRKVVVGR